MTHLSGSPATSADAHMSIADTRGAGPKKIASQPGNFKSPQFSPNAKYILFVARTNGDDDLVMADATGKPLCSLAVLEAGASFAWSPDGRRIAWINSSLTLQYPAPLSIFDLTTGVTTQGHDDAIAFFWSSDSRHIAVYSVVADGTPTNFTMEGKVGEQQPIVAQSGSQMLRIQILDAARNGATAVQVADTLPTNAVVDVLSFFDQYSRAVTPWSPDGKQLVYTSASHLQSRLDLVVATINSAGDKVDLNRVTAGVVAFWSPR
jgi:Tol biopolymer transport system component